MSVRIAVASTDGIVVNQHFGRTSSFYIYDYYPEENNLHAVEKRIMEPVCRYGEHSDKDLMKTINNISDCQYLLAVRVGNGACGVLEKNNIKVYEIPGYINESIDRMFRFEQVNKLIFGDE